MNLVQNMNENQLKAILKTEGAVMVIAGAGSGKTRVLTNRIAYLISEKNILESNILAITFTNKAAKEMKERIYSLVGETSKYIWINTFHSMCVRILRQNIELLGYNKNFTILDVSEQKSIIKNILKELNLSEDSYQPNNILKIISKAKNNMTSVSDMRSQSRFGFMKNVSEIYGHYQNYLKKNSVLDFDDLILKTIVLFEKYPEVLSIYQNKFQYIHVDEYQDTNSAQYKIVKLLVNSQQNICVVGDDWQSVYSFRGADFTNILNFQRDFAGAKVIKLEQNYRSTGNILSVAQKVIEKNLQRTDKQMWTEASDGEPVEVRFVADEHDEAFRIANLIRDLCNVYQLDEIAILYRTNAQSYGLERALISANLPYKIIGGVRFFDRKEVKDILAYLRLCYQPYDQVSLARIVNVPARGIGATTQAKFIAWWQASGQDIFTALKQLDQSDLPKLAQTKLAKFATVLQKIQAEFLAGTAPSELITKIIDWTGYDLLIKKDSLTAEVKLEYLDVLVNEARSYADIGSFLEDAALLSSSDKTADGGQVSLMTMHAAKGLEFPVVMVIGFEEGTFPHARVFEKPEELEEERRLCYVAMTRAKERLYLFSAGCRFVGGSRRQMLPSQFLADAGLLSTNADYTDDQGDDFLVDLINEFEVGDRVRSDIFGEGEVVDVDGLAVSVRFNDNQIRKLNVEFARLNKI